MPDTEWLHELRARCRDEATFEQVQRLLQGGAIADEAPVISLQEDHDRSTSLDASAWNSRTPLATDRRLPQPLPVAEIVDLQDYRLFIRAIERIRHNLDRSDILQAAVHEVLHYLKLDRVIITQFEPHLRGRFLSEAIADPEDCPRCIPLDHPSDLPSIDFSTPPNLASPSHLSCHFDHSSALECALIEQLQTYGVCSLVIAPIFCSDISWGGLVACRHSSQPISLRTRELLQQFGLSIGNALDHAELLEKSRIQSRKLATTLRTLQKTQTQLIQSEKMASLGQLVAGIAHEINNPVNFIYGNISYIRDYTEDLLATIDAYQAQFVETVDPLAKHIESLELDFIRQDLPNLVSSMHNGTARIRQIVQSLRTFSRLDEAESKTIDIHSGLDSVILLLRHRFDATDRRREIVVKRDYAELPPIHCYPAALNQVFVNLLSNAIDALSDRTDADPMITITTTRLNTEYIVIVVHDNGIGILPEHQPRIFDPFFTTKPPGKGTGLGLSVSYQIIVDTHEGELTCTSVPQEGCTLTIELPIHGRPE